MSDALETNMTFARTAFAKYAYTSYDFSAAKAMYELCAPYESLQSQQSDMDLMCFVGKLEMARWFKTRCPDVVVNYRSLQACAKSKHPASTAAKLKWIQSVIGRIPAALDEYETVFLEICSKGLGTDPVDKMLQLWETYIRAVGFDAFRTDPDTAKKGPNMELLDATARECFLRSCAVATYDTVELLRKCHGNLDSDAIFAGFRNAIAGKNKKVIAHLAPEIDHDDILVVFEEAAVDGDAYVLDVCCNTSVILPADVHCTPAIVAGLMLAGMPDRAKMLNAPKTTRFKADVFERIVTRTSVAIAKTMAPAHAESAVARRALGRAFFNACRANNGPVIKWMVETWNCKCEAKHRFEIMPRLSPDVLHLVFA